jgi:hypothetical protein
MIAEKAEESINQAVAYELQNIVKNYGAVYASEHEGYAVLLEETDEASDDLKYIHNCMNELWDEVKSDAVSKDFLNSIKLGAIELAKEAVQCAAVCERFLETIK